MTFMLTFDRRVPLAMYILAADMPLVRAYNGFHELREDFVQCARTHPGLYLDGLHLAAMGGEPYSTWN